MSAAVDPITLEVLRHRLWMINDEQGRVAASISGSPVVYEAKDFNASLLTPNGDAFFVGLSSLPSSRARRSSSPRWRSAP